MKEADHRFWPFRASASAFTSLGMFILIVSVVMAVHWKYEKPIPLSENTILIGFLIFSLLPVMLALADLFIERGGVLKYGDFQFELSRLERVAMSATPIQANVGVIGQSVNENTVENILGALADATSCDVAIVDLEDGQAWWETRLLVLLAGAERLKKPQKIVFVGTVGAKLRQFKGWAHPDELLDRLIDSDEQYQRSFFKAKAVARQWELVVPIDRTLIGPVGEPPAHQWMNLAMTNQFNVKPYKALAGLPNPFLAEQLLAADLGEKFERQENPKTLTFKRFNNLFASVLVKEHIDRNWPPTRQSDTFFRLQSQFVVVTNDDAYELMVSKLDLLLEMIEPAHVKMKS